MPKRHEKPVYPCYLPEWGGFGFYSVEFPEKEGYFIHVIKRYLPSNAVASFMKEIRPDGADDNLVIDASGFVYGVVDLSGITELYPRFDDGEFFIEVAQYGFDRFEDFHSEIRLLCRSPRFRDYVEIYDFEQLMDWVDGVLA